MAYYFLTASKDASVYLQQPNQNTGLDEILEISKIYYGNIKDVSRALLKFDVGFLSASLSNGTIKMQDANLDSEKIKMVTNNYLVSATTLPEALDNITESLKGTVSDMTIVGIKSSPIVDIFPYKESTEVEEKELVEEN